MKNIYMILMLLAFLSARASAEDQVVMHPFSVIDLLDSDIKLFRGYSNTESFFSKEGNGVGKSIIYRIIVFEYDSHSEIKSHHVFIIIRDFWTVKNNQDRLTIIAWRLSNDKIVWENKFIHYGEQAKKEWNLITMPEYFSLGQEEAGHKPAYHPNFSKKDRWHMIKADRLVSPGFDTALTNKQVGRLYVENSGPARGLLETLRDMLKAPGLSFEIAKNSQN
jgi:hypothetical protein